MAFRELKESIDGLASSRISDRKRCANYMRDVINNEQVIRMLRDTNSACNWNYLLVNVDIYMFREAEKIIDESKVKKRAPSVISTHISASVSLFISVVRKANSDGFLLALPKLMNIIIKGFENKVTKTLYGDAYLQVLLNDVLTQRLYRRDITHVQWKSLFPLIKNLHSTKDFNKSNIVQTFHLCIKWCAYYTSLAVEFREHDDFVREVTMELKPNMLSSFVEASLSLLITFSMEFSKTYRLSSCKLGEDVIHRVIDMYENHFEEYGGRKTLIFDFLLLQIRIHHPNGSIQQSPCAYAYNWDKWKFELKAIYSMIKNEIDLINRHETPRLGKKLQKLWSNFLALVVEVLNQFIMSGMHETSQAKYDSAECLPGPSKKIKLDIEAPYIISFVQSGTNWCWLSVLTELLNTYPECLSFEDFMPFLQSLANLQKEINDPLTRHYLYDLLSTIVVLQNNFKQNGFDMSAIQCLWTNIYETSLHVVGLNQDDESAHKFLQILLHNKTITKTSALVQIFASDRLYLSVHSIETLHALICTKSIPEKLTINNDEINMRIHLINWILGLNKKKTASTSHFNRTVTADVVILLTSKSWPPKKECRLTKTLERQHKDIERLYILSSLEDVVYKPPSDSTLSTDNKKYLVHPKTLQSLLVIIEDFLTKINSIDASDHKLLIKNCAHLILILRVISRLVDLELVKLESLNVDIEQLINNFTSKLTVCLNNENEHNVVVDVFNSIKSVCDIHSSEYFLVTIRNGFPKSFWKFVLKEIVKSMDGASGDDKEDDLRHYDVIKNQTASLLDFTFSTTDRMKIHAISLISAFCCNSHIKNFNEMQSNLLEYVFNMDLPPAKVVNFRIITIFLKALNTCKIGCLSAEHIESMLTCLENFLHYWYMDAEAAVILMNILSDMMRHIKVSATVEIKNHAVALLLPFYELKSNLSPKECCTLIRCMSTIIKLDPFSKWSSWPNDAKLSEEILEFICSDSNEVRLMAIKHFMCLFDKSLYPMSESVFARQKTLLEKLKILILNSFTMTANLSVELETDEGVNRTSCALQTYCAIIVNSPLWRKDILYTLLIVMVDRNINIGIIDKTLIMLQKQLNTKTMLEFLEINMNYIINNWFKDGRAITDFPYRLYKCDSFTEFLSKYLHDIIPCMLQNEEFDHLKDICNTNKLNILTVLEKALPKFAPLYMPALALENSQYCSEIDVEKGKTLYRRLLQAFPSQEMVVLTTRHCAQIFMNIMYHLSDTEHFTKQFGFSQLLPKPDPPNFNHEMIGLIMKYIERQISPSRTFINYLVIVNKKVMENLLLQATTDLYTMPTIEEKLNSLHRYAVLVNYIIPALQYNSELNPFFLRSIIHTLVYLIKVNTEHSLLNIAACRFFTEFCSKSVSHCAKIFEKYLIFITSTLVPIAKQDTKLSDECLVLLNLLIVNNSSKLFNAIEKLDPFPNTAKFNKLADVHKKIKYGNTSYTLEQEINHFLNVGYMTDENCRAEGLEHLNILLSTRRGELSDIYEKHEKFNGFSEECQGSLIHQLLAMLVQLTKSSDHKTSLEAAKCLGELGPADLNTMGLKPKKITLNSSVSPIQLFVGRVVILLSKYLVDPDINVVKTSSDALYCVMGSDVGKQLTDEANLIVDYDNGLVQKEYILPFINRGSPISESKTHLNVESFCKNIDNYNLWCPRNACTHKLWITELVCALLKEFPIDSFFKSLIPVCEVKVELCENLLPIIVYLVLYNNPQKCASIVSTHIGNFFDARWQSTDSTSPLISKNRVIFNKASIHCMLDLVQFTRLIKYSNHKNNCSELDLDYLKISLTAQHCSAYFTALMYAELWCYEKLNNQGGTFENLRSMSLLERAYDNENEQLQKNLYNILRESHEYIGDTDAVTGFDSSNNFNSESHMEYCRQTSRWDKITMQLDLEMSNNPNMTPEAMVDSLKNSGLYYLAYNMYSDMPKINYECLWRLSQWDLDPEFRKSDLKKLEFDECHYSALQAFHEQDYDSVSDNIASARESVIDSLTHVSLETSKNLYNPLMQLQLLSEIECVSEKVKEDDTVSAFLKLDTRRDLKNYDFKFNEPIMTQQVVLMKEVMTRKYSTELNYLLINAQLKLADDARIEGYNHISQRVLSQLSLQEKDKIEAAGQIMLQQAQLYWPDDNSSGRNLLRTFLKKYKNIQPKIYAKGLKLFGSWTAQTCSENPQIIIDDYFLKSLDTVKKYNAPEDMKEKCKTMSALAQFADSQYQQLTTYIDSSEFQLKISTVAKFREISQKMRQQLEKALPENEALDIKRAMISYDRQATIDQEEIDNSKKERDRFLELAIRHYLMLLQNSEEYNLISFRILSLCLLYKNSRALDHLLKEYLPKIPSHKFISLLPQLVPHVNTGGDLLFDKHVNKLLERCAIDHPHHTLPLIMALANSYNDPDAINVPSSSDNVGIRVEAAKQMINKLKKETSLKRLIEDMEKLSSAVIKLAYLEVKNPSENMTIPRNEPIRSIKNLDNVLLPTVNLAVRPNCNYRDIIGIREINSIFSFVGGINAPKKIRFMGTDGVYRTTLIKGRDDLKQDAVMQQVFTIMNTLLARNRDTNKLLIRTYKVVPLSKRCGIIEWCEGTEPLGNYLLKAHPKYFPNDWPASKCRNMMRDAKNDFNVKFNTFKKICENFHPVFHMFFFDTFPHPAIWFERRRAYVNSVATSSMVGYILGIGDRHVQNILIDKNTAEVIHIDFGIAFEQGRVLPTPETVPFRLTRDIEAGMGICSTEGVFRRSCEKTMTVLRSNLETIQAIIEVLLYDPLYSWTITSAQAYKRQKDDTVLIKFLEEDYPPVNLTAERALLRLKQKLQGSENGGLSSVEGQVEKLIQQARDPSNLCRLFQGWQPYL